MCRVNKKALNGFIMLIEITLGTRANSRTTFRIDKIEVITKHDS